MRCASSTGKVTTGGSISPSRYRKRNARRRTCGLGVAQDLGLCRPFGRKGPIFRPDACFVGVFVAADRNPTLVTQLGSPPLRRLRRDNAAWQGKVSYGKKRFILPDAGGMPQQIDGVLTKFGVPFSVMIATLSAISHSSSSVPVSTGRLDPLAVHRRMMKAKRR